MKRILAAIVLLALAIPASAGQTITKNFNSATGRSRALRLTSGESMTYSVVGTFSQKLYLEISKDGTNWSRTGIQALSTTASGTYYADDTNVGPGGALFSWHCDSYTSGSSTVTIADVDDVVRQFPNHKGAVIFQLNDDTAVVNGGLTATTFTGDGSALTGVPAASVPANLIGTTQIANSAVTDAKIATMTASKLTGTFSFTSATKATILATAAGKTGSAIYCTDCSTVPVCVSTGTLANQWSAITSKATACN